MKMNKIFLTISLILLASCSRAKHAATTHHVTSEIRFRFDNHELLPKYRPTLSESLAYLKENAGSVLILEGHTDRLGTDDHNLDLGDRRALSVKSWFRENGVAPDRLITVSFGENKPKKAYTTTRQNRRVVIATPKTEGDE